MRAESVIAVIVTAADAFEWKRYRRSCESLESYIKRLHDLKNANGFWKRR